MKYAGGTIDEGAVKAAGGEVLPDGSGVRVGGWTIATGHGPITADADLDSIKQSLNIIAAPEQFYGANFLRLRHDASGTVISFTALDALKGWLQDKSERVRIGESEEWMAARREDVEQHAAQTLEYDWTFSTSYAGSLEREGASSTATDGSGGDGSGSGEASALAAAGGSDGSRTPASAQQMQQAGQEPQGSAAGGKLPRWQASSEQIPRALLTSRDPILFYDELPLYESELDDHGSSRVTVKMRVMPHCWYVLLRFWLRVDRVMVRLRETRVFCQFDGPSGGAVVLREVKHHEGTFEALRAAGAPAEGPAYADADTAAQALMAVAPVGVTHYRLERLLLA